MKWSIITHIALNKGSKIQYWPIYHSFPQKHLCHIDSFEKAQLLPQSKFLVTSENKVTKKPFCMYYYYFWNGFFKSYKILIYLHPVLSKSIHFCIFMIQNSSKVFLYSHILSFLKIFPWNQNFSSYLDCPHYVWNKKVQKVQGDKIDVTIYS